jgi:3-oxoacyl-[acyl-carrier protein] reductase
MVGWNDPGSAGTVAIITGGSWGAGLEVVNELAGRGYSVVMVYLRDQRAAEAVVEDILAAGGTALAVRADVTDELDVERLFDETAATFGGIDAVVHAERRGTFVVNERAALRLRRGGAIVSISTAEAIAPALACELRARDITVNGLAPGLEPPGADHDAAELVGLLERSRRGT